MKFHHLIILSILFFASCKTSKVVVAPPIIENRDLDTLVVSAPKPDKLKEAEEYRLPKYAPTYSRTNDLIHTKLKIKFDWANQYVLGRALLTLKPHFYDTNKVTLDAKGFQINEIKMDGKALKYDYDEELLTIHLGKTYNRNQEYSVFIDYVAKPAEQKDKGGSAAITSNQGLFFINHDGSDPDKPQQIWTQGETEWNSRWFPTIDKPNERCTQEMYITVQDKFKTLSNGVLVSSEKQTDGTRIDYWKMDQPHAPYLFMIAVGEFAVVKDSWKGKAVDYYVEPEYESHAKAIFANTTEMLDFFSEKLGIEYPWPKYSQIVVKDYVSGAMENTSAVIFGDFVQQTTDDLIDDHNDKIIAHELFHHWFGDLVTCESWANLTMNEGFANYSEYLWMDHKYGKDEADYHLLSEINGYLGEARTKMHPLIHFGYNDKEDMFDSHSYNKGALVLHMLRNHVGDDAFFAALNKYLNDNEYSDVEAHELRLAFEDVTGQDMNWFFDQWYFAAGHPDLKIDYEYEARSQKAIVLVEQIQNATRQPAIFDLPFAIDIYDQSGKATRHEVRMTQRRQIFKFDTPSEPPLVNVDADKILLCEKQDNKSEAAYIFQYQHAPLFLDRYEALKALENSSSMEAKKILSEALTDKFWAIRGIAIDMAEVEEEMMPTYEKMATNDKHSEVRAAAIEILGESGDKKYLPTIKKAIETDKVGLVVSAALQALVDVDMDEAIAYSSKLKDSDNSEIINALGNIYAESGDMKHMNFYEENWDKVDGYEGIEFLSNYLYLAVSGGDDSTTTSLIKLEELATSVSQSPWRRFGATKAIFDLKNEYGQAVLEADGEKKARFQQKANYLSGVIDKIVRQETNTELLEIYQQFTSR